MKISVFPERDTHTNTHTPLHTHWLYPTPFPPLVAMAAAPLQFSLPKLYCFVYCSCNLSAFTFIFLLTHRTYHYLLPPLSTIYRTETHSTTLPGVVLTSCTSILTAVCCQDQTFHVYYSFRQHQSPSLLDWIPCTIEDQSCHTIGQEEAVRKSAKEYLLFYHHKYTVPCGMSSISI